MMKSAIICALVLVNFVLVCTAQITFTREWAAGKRSGSQAVGDNPEGVATPATFAHLRCKSLQPLIQRLIEEEKFRSAVCKHGSLPKKFVEKYSPSLMEQNSQDADDESSESVVARGQVRRR